MTAVKLKCRECGAEAKAHAKTEAEAERKAWRKIHSEKTAFKTT